MFHKLVLKRAAFWLVSAVMLGLAASASFSAGAQAEPTLNQVYEAAQAGRVDQAQIMMQQVLVAHPDSAKAHFVQAELFARQGKIARAREALAAAEKRAPGLPFAKADAVKNLRAQLAAGAADTSMSQATVATNTLPVAPASSFPWGIALALGGGAIALLIFMTRRKTAPGPGPVWGNGAQPAYTGTVNGDPMHGGLAGPQSFGMPGATAAPGYGPQPGFGQPVGGGLGGKVMGGLATGLAVGAGVMAAQAIGKSLMGNNEHPHNDNPAGSPAGSNYQPYAGNSDLGGQNFGVNDAGSWDDASSVASSGGGSDWDDS